MRNAVRISLVICMNRFKYHLHSYVYLLLMCIFAGGGIAFTIKGITNYSTILTFGGIIIAFSCVIWLNMFINHITFNSIDEFNKKDLKKLDEQIKDIVKRQHSDGDSNTPPSSIETEGNL